MGIFRFLFGKKKKVGFPTEYCLVTFNDIALRNGIEDNANKIIIRYRYNFKIEKMEVYRVYGYSDSMLAGLKNTLKIPFYDRTLTPIKFPIYNELRLDEVSYKKA